MNDIAEKVLARCDELVFSYIWRAFTYLACVNKNREAILHQIDKLRVSLNENSVRFKYVLVIGRNAEKDNSEKRRAMFAEKSDNDIRVMTYDSLVG